MYVWYVLSLCSSWATLFKLSLGKEEQSLLIIRLVTHLGIVLIFMDA